MSEEETTQDTNKEVAVVEPKKELTPMNSGGSINAIVPKDHVEAFRFAKAFVSAGMIPNSYSIKRNSQGKEVKEWDSSGILDIPATEARIAIGIMKGMEIGLPPVTALSTICVINNRPCLWGDGAIALIQKSGKLEWTKDWITGSWSDGSYVHYFQVKRRDQSEPITRQFGFSDAKAAGLLGKKGPWAGGYGARMCFNRARAWASRDGFSDVLMGIGIAEEVRDTPTENHQEVKPDLESLKGVAVVEESAPLDGIEELVGRIDFEEQQEPDLTDEERDFLSVIDELTPALEGCDSMAKFQLFWLDNIKSCESLQSAPQSIQDKWDSMVEAQKAKFD